ncbi:MAG: hypothetical protein V1793_04195 [Pseudomonadota bacterium]
MKILPQATVVHRMNGRIRIRIAGVETGRELYFNGLSDALNKAFAYRSIRVNSVTGSLLLEDPDINLDAVAGYGLSRNLFRLETRTGSGPGSVARVARTQVRRIDSGIRKLTSGNLDMSGSVFVVLIIHAMREIMSGNLAVPSWFTALWFASTIYNRDFYGPGGDGVHSHDDGGHAYTE